MSLTRKRSLVSDVLQRIEKKFNFKDDTDSDSDVDGKHNMVDIFSQEGTEDSPSTSLEDCVEHRCQ